MAIRNVRLAATVRNAALNAAVAALSGGYLQFYTGAQPTSSDVAVGSQVLLASLPLSTPAAGSAAGGSVTFNPVTPSVALASGVAAWFRLVASDGVTGIVDGTVSTDGSGDLLLNDLNFTLGATVQVSTFTLSQQ